MIQHHITVRLLTIVSVLDLHRVSTSFNPSVRWIGVSVLAVSYSHARMSERQNQKCESPNLQSTTPITHRPPDQKNPPKTWKGVTAAILNESKFQGMELTSIREGLCLEYILNYGGTSSMIQERLESKKRWHMPLVPATREASGSRIV